MFNKKHLLIYLVIILVSLGWIVTIGFTQSKEINSVEDVLRDLNSKSVEARSKGLSNLLALPNDSRKGLGPILISLLEDKRKINGQPLAQQAALVLSRVGKDAFIPLMQALKNAKLEGKEYFALALANLRFPDGEIFHVTQAERVVQYAGDIARKEVYEVRSTVYEQLNLQGSEYEKQLIFFLESDCWQVRLAALRILGFIKSPEGKVEIRKLLNDSLVQVRREAINTLGEIGDFSDIADILKMLKDKDLSVREAAAEALSKLRWQTQKTMQDNLEVETKIEVDFNQALDKDLIKDILIAALSDESGKVKKIAIDLTGVLGDLSMVEYLKPLLQDKNRYIQLKVITALGKIGGKKAEEILIELLNGDDKIVRGYALDTLKGIFPEVGFQDDYQLWRKWWENKEEGLL